MEEAAALLWQVTECRPGEEAYWRELLQVLVRLDDKPAIERVLNALRVLGRGEAYVQALVADTELAVTLIQGQPDGR